MTTRVPRLVLVILGIALLASTVMMIAGGWLGGVTWDEKTHVFMLQTFFDQGWNVTPDALINGEPDPGYIWGVYVYGPVGELVAHAVTVAAGSETWGQLNYEAASYAARHVGIGLMALAGVGAVGLTVRLITRSWGYALLGATMLAVTPLWLGHGMFNIKDLPVASGYAIATLGIVALCRSDYFERLLMRLSAILALALGAVLASGTREAVGVPIAAGVVGALTLLWLWQVSTRGGDRRAATKDVLRRLLEGAGGLVLAYLLLVLIYPKAFINPVVLAWQALVVSARFPFNEPVLTSGTWMDQPPPWTYLPYWFLAQLPLIVTVFSLLFLAVWIAALIRQLAGRRVDLDGFQFAMVGAVLLQALLMPVLAIALRSNMYNGSRQFLFVVPALAVLATLGIWWAMQRASRLEARRALAVGGLWTAVTLGVVAPLVAQSTLFPYNYTYFNAVAASQPLEGHWPTDYWRFSSRDLMQRLPASGAESCGYEQARADELHPCSDEPMFAPYLDLRGSNAQPGTLGPGQYWLVRENQGITDLPEGCTLHDEITRPLFLQTVVIGQIAKCDGDAL